VKEKLIQAFGNLADSAVAVVPGYRSGFCWCVRGLSCGQGHRTPLTDGVDRALQRLGLRQELATLFPRLAYFLVSDPGQNRGQCTRAARHFECTRGIFAYLPNLVSALLLLIVGSTVGQFAGQTVS
jgi:Mechanosensitive ion channel, conserved TM helix